MTLQLTPMPSVWGFQAAADCLCGVAALLQQYAALQASISMHYHYQVCSTLLKVTVTVLLRVQATSNHSRARLCSLACCCAYRKAVAAAAASCCRGAGTCVMLQVKA